MDRITNPFAPGAGSQPPELAGRDEVRETVRVALERVKRGRPAKSVMLVGLRGVGKTVLLDKMREDAIRSGFTTARIEAPERRSLPALIAPQLRSAILEMSRIEAAKELGARALRALAGFANALKVKYQDIEVGLDLVGEPGLADNGDLEHDLQELLEAVGVTAAAANTVFAIFIDELQYVEEDELAVLIAAMHRMAQRGLPVVLVGAGLPQLRSKLGEAKSYAERLFDFPEIGALPPEAARRALVKPAQDEGADFTDDAVTAIIDRTKGYPYFLQEWGSHAWNVAPESPIDLNDVQAASESAIAAMDESFFLVRFDRLTPLEKRYLRAMAELGAGPHRSGDIAEVLGRPVTGLAPTRSNLIVKGMVWSPSHGDTAFTVPLFDEFMKRIIPAMD